VPALLVIDVHYDSYGRGVTLFGNQIFRLASKGTHASHTLM
jgi:hypothetical protein